VVVRLNEISGDGVVVYLLLGPVQAVFIVSALVALLDRSFAAGVQVTLWAVVVSCLLIFATYVLEALRWQRTHGSFLLDGDSGPVGANLNDGIGWVLIVIPMWALPIGIIGAALGSIGNTGTRHVAASS
jgi:hypothetical protein